MSCPLNFLRHWWKWCWTACFSPQWNGSRESLKINIWKMDFQVFWNHVPARVILHPNRILFKLTFKKVRLPSSLCRDLNSGPDLSLKGVLKNSNSLMFPWKEITFIKCFSSILVCWVHKNLCHLQRLLQRNWNSIFWDPRIKGKQVNGNTSPSQAQGKL